LLLRNKIRSLQYRRFTVGLARRSQTAGKHGLDCILLQKIGEFFGKNRDLEQG
jgi:hypothetical protein